MDGIAAACQGRLGGDGELKYSAQGKPLFRFSVGVQDAYGQERGEPVQWLRVVAFGPLAEQLGEQGLRKGVECYCEGKVKLARWTGSDGQERAELELVAFVVQPLGQVGRRRERDRAAIPRA